MAARGADARVVRSDINATETATYLVAVWSPCSLVTFWIADDSES